MSRVRKSARSDGLLELRVAARNDVTIACDSEVWTKFAKSTPPIVSPPDVTLQAAPL